MTIGELEPLSASIRLVDYDPGWPDRFRREAERIRAVLGDRVLQLEHVGSTAVPGLPAKPVIDLALELENSADEPAYVSAMEAAIEGRVSNAEFKWSPQPAVCVVVASGGYPGSFTAGKKIVGLEKASQRPGVKVFHAGTSYQDGTYYTTGGRVLGVTARADTLGGAMENAYAAISGIGFEGMNYRKDIAARAVKS